MRAIALALLCSAVPVMAQGADGCFTVHGRLALYNGTPSFRIWQIGTGHILAVPDGPPSHEDDNLPENVRRLVWQTAVFGDFRVCPLTPARVGRMQMVRVESARITGTQTPK